MKRKERYIASLDEVTITRAVDYAWIAYKEEAIGVTRLQIGPEIAEMSDREILPPCPPWPPCDALLLLCWRFPPTLINGVTEQVRCRAQD